MNKISTISMLLMLCACGGGYQAANEQFMTDFAAGNYEIAAQGIAAATQDPEKDTNNVYLGGLQCSAGYLWSGNVESLDMCTANTDAVLIGEIPENSGYEIKSYEKIAFKTYQGIGAILNGDDYAKQILNQANEYQTESVNENDDEIAEAQAQLEEDAATLSGAPSSSEMVAAALADFDAYSEIAPMKNYENPYTIYLQSLYLGMNKKSDFQFFNNRLKSFVPDNSFVKSDADALSAKSGSVWVFFENGLVGPIKKRALAPEALQGLGIKLTVPDVGAGFPALSHLHIQAGDKSVNTEFVANMDSIVKTDLDKYKTGNIIKSVAFEVGKLAAATAAKVAGDKMNEDLGGYGALIGTISAIAIQTQVEYPWDLRSWTALPNEIQSARIAMPSDRTIVINGEYTVEIPEGIKNAVVFVRIPTPTAVPSIAVGKLN